MPLCFRVPVSKDRPFPLGTITEHCPPRISPGGIALQAAVESVVLDTSASCEKVAPVFCKYDALI